MAWTALIIAGLLESVWAIALKRSHNLTQVWPSVVTVVGLLASLALLSWCMGRFAAGTAYAVWTGVGATATFSVGVAFFGETCSPPRVLAVLLIIGGVALMNVAAP